MKRIKNCLMVGLLTVLPIFTGFADTRDKMEEKFHEKYQQEGECIFAQLRAYYQNGYFTSKHMSFFTYLERSTLFKMDECPDKFYAEAITMLKGYCYFIPYDSKGEKLICGQGREEPCDHDLPFAEQLQLCRYQNFPVDLPIKQIFDRLVEIAKEYDKFLAQINAETSA